MRRRSSDEAPFLDRPDEVWASVSRKPAQVMRDLHLLGGLVLARRGLLRPDEVTRLERIAAGVEHYVRLAPESAAQILAAVPARAGTPSG